MDESTHHLLSKLHQVFKDGYRPARGNESYAAQLKNGVLAGDMINCFGHTFNLRNQQLDDYQFTPDRIYGYFPAEPGASGQTRAQPMLDFIQETGLRVAACDPNEPITDFKSWKIALYFAPSDFHFLLEEAPGRWSSKLGFSFEVDQNLYPPQKYYGAFDYNLFNTYKITNPHADANNRYLQGRTL